MFRVIEKQIYLMPRKIEEFSALFIINYKLFYNLSDKLDKGCRCFVSCVMGGGEDCYERPVFLGLRQTQRNRCSLCPW